MRPGVVISGCGVVSPLGRDLAAFDDALFAARSAVRGEPLELPGQPTLPVPLARCDLDLASVESPSRVPLDRGTALALVAAQDAMAQAGLSGGDFDGDRAGLYWGSGMGGASSFDAQCRQLYAEHRRLRPTSVVTTMPNAPLAELALRFGLRGSAIGYACACASAAVAIGEALRAIRAGALDLALVGGSEALLTTGVIAAWQAMRVLGPAAPDACRPFAADRLGFALGEGAAAFVLESAEHARARGATAQGELLGYGGSCDAMHITQPHADGQARALRAALADARLDAAAIGHVNAHGTGTGAGDAAEAASLRQVFGNHGPAVTATKSVTGHLLGAGGAVELLATLRALHHRRIPPTAHVAADDPALGLDLVRGTVREAPDLQYALSNSFAFGGTNAVLVVARG